MKWIDTFRVFGGADVIDPTEVTVIDIPKRISDDAGRRTELDRDLDDKVKQRQISLAVEYAARARAR